jgi:dihydrofolate reductase
MTMISLVAVMDENRGLGKDNQLLCHLPADLKHFKALTLNKPVIMGRKTFQSIGKALPDRFNIVLSRQSIAIDKVTVVDSLSKAIKLAAGWPEIMVIGGATLFEEAMPLAQRVYLTVIHSHFDADVFFPALNPDVWSCCERLYRQKDEQNHFDLTFYQYQRVCQKGEHVDHLV